MRRILLLILGLLVFSAPLLNAQPKGRPRPQFIDPEQLDPGEGARVLEQFRTARLAGDYAFQFDLRHMPRNAASTTYQGTMWGTWLPDGRAVTRVRLDTPAGPLRLLQVGGQPGEFYRQVDDQPVSELTGEAKFQPLVGEMTYTPFELQMPFLFWMDYTYEGTEKVRGRPAHYFLLYPPDDFQLTEVGAVRVIIDADFNALLRAEILDPEGKPLKTFRINSFKKADDQWIVKEIDLLDERTRDKTRFTVRAAHVGMNLPTDFFTQEALPVDSEPVAPEDYQRL